MKNATEVSITSHGENLWKFLIKNKSGAQIIRWGRLHGDNNLGHVLAAFIWQETQCQN